MTLDSGTRIAFIVSSLHGGGAEAVGVAWMNWFAQAGYDVDAILVSDKPGSDLVDPAIRIHGAPARGGPASTVASVRRILRRERYDAVIALQTFPNLVAIAAAGQKGTAWRPIVVATEHNVVSLGLPGSSLSHRAKIWLAKRWYRRADVVTSASHPVAAEMTAAFGVPASRSLIVPNPAMAKVVDRAPVSRTPGTGNGLQLVLACRLVPQKSPQLALRAARVLQDRGIPTEVVSFGGGPLHSEMVALADVLRVPFTAHGWVEDWFSHFAENSVVILPSHREGLGNVLIEAAARGVPSTAVSTALGVADAVIPGVTGELALDDDPASIADAIERAAGLEVSGVEDWLERFSARSSAGKLRDAIAYAHARAA